MQKTHLKEKSRIAKHSKRIRSGHINFASLQIRCSLGIQRKKCMAICYLVVNLYESRDRVPTSYVSLEP